MSCLQTDISVRFQKLRGRHCIYLCADDTHGTAIIIRTRQEKQKREEALIADMSQGAVSQTSSGFTSRSITTAAPTAKRTANSAGRCGSGFAANLVVEKEVTQLYDVEAGTFLADRFGERVLPQLQIAPINIGDSCDKCGAAYTAPPN